MPWCPASRSHQVDDGPRRSMLTGYPLGIEQRHGTGLHGHGHAHVEQAAGGIRGVHTQLDRGLTIKRCAGNCQPDEHRDSHPPIILSGPRSGHPWTVLSGRFGTTMKDEEGMERTQMADNYVYIREQIGRAHVELQSLRHLV